ncbi:Crp/Fnr family transcriptional regulator [Rhodoligotrophos defluvii]|uniref:Crp/Fnr family transcriptional regulator n=1 Tax=Rhodoligotrophos defluvii TaxID=2561934 RepID=UPI0010C9A7F5|nr:Crp/Fnr family transcriptional regulator [Rhodoligotrophos defluvii]
MHNPMILRLEHGADLTDTDRTKLAELSASWHSAEAKIDLIREYEEPEHVRIVLEGFACRYKILANGRRSIVAFLVPGDFCDLHVPILGEMDHSIGTITSCKVVEISHPAINDVTERFPRIARALWWSSLVDEGTLRAWLATMGQLPADKQMAHLFCELHLRLKVVGYVSGTTFPMPMSQEDLADALGISTVHANRVLQQLREDGLVVLRGKMLTIPDPERLTEFAEFHPNYLHLNRKSKLGRAMPEEPVT